MRITLRQKFVGTTVALVLIVAVTCAVFLKTTVHNALENEVDRRAVAIARHFAELSADASLSGSTSLLQTHIRDYIASDSLLAYIIILHNGNQVQAHSFASDPPTQVLDAIQGQWDRRLSLYFTGPEGERMEDFRVPVGASGGFVHIGVHESKIDAEVNKLLERLTPTLLLLLLAGVLAAYLLSSIMTRHISTLMAGVARVSAGNLDVTINVKSRDEIGDVARAFNSMAHTLQSTMVSREFMEKLINTMNDVLVVIAPDGVVQSVNQAFCTLFACESSCLVGHHADEFGEETPPARMFAAYHQALRDGRFNGIECLSRGCHGDPVPLLLSLAVMKDDAGLPQAIICAAQDISGLKNAQEELHQKQDELEAVNRNLEEMVSSRTAELAVGNESLRAEVAERQRKTEELRAARDAAESANRAKTEFLANMSHEMRTPLNSIIGGTEFLESADLTGDQRRCLDMIRTAGDSLLVQVNDLIDLARIEAGQLELLKREFNLADLLEGVVRMLQIQGDAKQLELSLAIAPDLPHFVIGDRLRLQQVLINLVSNAIKFTDSGGRVTVSAQRGRDLENAVEVYFAVRDTGIGIEQDKLDMIFDTFAQADSSITRRYGGSGLGLSISRKLVEVMGGNFRVESAPGVGSLFIFNIEFTLSSRAVASNDSRPEQAPSVDAAEPAPTAGRSLVLLVDDARENRELMKLLLASQPLEIHEAANGLEGVQLFGQNDYRLVLMDIQMPVMDGYNATREIRSLEEREGRPPATVVALTAHAYEDDIRRCREAGCDDHIAKPFKKKRLLQCLAQYLPGVDHG